MSAEQRVTDEELDLALGILQSRENAEFADGGLAAALDLRDSRAAHRATEAKLRAALAEVAAWKSRFTTLPEGYEISDDATVPLAIAFTSQAMQLDHAREQIIVLCQQNTQWETARDSWAEQLTTTESALAATKAKLEAATAALRQHHKWHLDAGEMAIAKDDKGEWIALDMSAEYGDSTLCEITLAALTTKETTDETTV